MSKSPSLRRIQADVRELAIDPSSQYHAAPLENDMFEWHFTIRGAPDTDFEGGTYHGRILLPAEYPFKPPNIMFTTPSGRFETGVKVCLSFSAFHPELWQPAWGIRLILEALISFLPTKGDGAIGALDWTSEERKRLAKKSVGFCCPQCGDLKTILKNLDERCKIAAPLKKEGAAGKKSKFQTEIEQLHVLQIAAEGERKMKEGGNEKSSSAKEGGDAAAAETTETKSATPEPTLETKEPSLVECKSDHTNVIPNGENSNNEANSLEQHSSVNHLPPMEETNTSDNPNEPTTTPTIEPTTPPPPPTSENDTIPATTPITNVDTTPSPATPPPPPAAEQPNPLDSSWISDPMAHAGIIVFSVIIWMLVKKVQAIMADMLELEAQMHSASD